MSWFNFFKKGITVRDTETWGKILLKYKSVIPEYYFDKGEDIILGIRSSLFIPQAEIEKWGRLRNECDELNKSIDKTAQLNNQGIANEEQKEFDKAIEFYEENLNVGGIATHSYDRLMILYRKRKQYSDELRVIDLVK